MQNSVPNFQRDKGYLSITDACVYAGLAAYTDSKFIKLDGSQTIRKGQSKRGTGGDHLLELPLTSLPVHQQLPSPVLFKTNMEVDPRQYSRLNGLGVLFTPLAPSLNSYAVKQCVGCVKLC